MSKATLKAAVLGLSIILPAITFAAGKQPLTLTDSKGTQYQVKKEVRVIDEKTGQSLADGTYTRANGKTVTIKDGQVLLQRKGQASATNKTIATKPVTSQTKTQ